jgi:hypothetical protein
MMMAMCNGMGPAQRIHNKKVRSRLWSFAAMCFKASPIAIATAIAIAMADDFLIGRVSLLLQETLTGYDLLL